MKKLSSVAKPKLRFEGFSDYWNVKKLGEYLSFKNGINADKDSYGKGYKFINVLDIINNDFITNELITGSVDVDEKVFEKNEVSYGDILFQRSSENREEAGQSNVYLDPDVTSCFGGFVIRGKAKKSYNPVYLNYLLKTHLARKEIVTKSGGSTRYNVGQDTLSEVNIYISDNELEQQKIAEFISSVDKKISLLKEKHISLTQFKKAVMQKLLKQEIRFKDEHDNSFPDWKETKLNNLISECSEKSVVEDEYPVLSSTIKGIEKRSGRVDGASNIGYKIIRREQLVLSPQNLWLGNINYNDSFEVGLVSPSYKTFTFNTQLINPNYGKYLIKTPRMIYEYTVSSEMGASVVRRNLNMELFGGIKVSIPSIQEQMKVADFLDALDTKLDAINKQIELTQTFKKGLLQQMFV